MYRLYSQSLYCYLRDMERISYFFFFFLPLYYSTKVKFSGYMFSRIQLLRPSFLYFWFMLINLRIIPWHQLLSLWYQQCNGTLLGKEAKRNVSRRKVSSKPSKIICFENICMLHWIPSVANDIINLYIRGTGAFFLLQIRFTTVGQQTTMLLESRRQSNL